MSAILPLFDAVIESSKVGVHKPDPRIYRLMCEQLAFGPVARVYLDDLGINCKPAAALGTRAISRSKGTGVDQSLDELSVATGVSFE